MQQRTGYDIKSQEEYARTLGAGLFVEVDPHSLLLLGIRSSEPTRSVPVRPHTISRTASYRGTIYEKDGSKFILDTRLEKAVTLRYDDVWTQLGQLNKGEFLAIQAISPPKEDKIQYKIAKRESAKRAKRRKIREGSKIRNSWEEDGRGGD